MTGVGEGEEARPHQSKVPPVLAGARDRGLPAAISLLLLVIVLSVGAHPAAGQAGQDTTKSRTELIRDRIRTIGPLIKHPDSVLADSIRADSLARAADRGIRLAPVEGLSGAARDSVMEELLRLTGYAVTEYKSEEARFEADSGRLDLRIGAEVVRDRQRLAADSGIIFLQESNIACAYGLPMLSGEGSSPVRADSLCYNVDTKRGIAHGATTEVTEGATWIVFSEQSFTVDETVYSHGGVFTDCELEEPHYHFGAGELKVIRGDIMVARNVTFNFRDVPVFWLPFFVQSMKRGRRSGVLFPRFGINDIARNSKSYKRRVEDVGFYWAINDYMGAEMALDWQADNFTSLRGTFDFRHLRKFLAGSVTYRNYWRAEGGTEFSLAGQTDWQPNERTRLNGNVSYVTSTRFVQQNSIDPRELNRSIDSRMGINRRFDFGSLNVSGSRQQFLSDNTVNMTFPTVGFSLNSITLFPALPGESSWYNNATWTGSFNSNMRSRTVSDDNANLRARSNREVTTKMTSNFQMGKFSWSQDFGYTDQRDLERTFAADTIDPLPERYQKRIQWSTGLNFQQRLMGNTTFTPGLRMRGEMLEADTTGGERVAAPTRIDFSAALRTDLYAFIGGFGPIERIRHRISPGFSYSYSPSPTITDRQREVFNVRETREQNRLTISLSQTFEAKMKNQEGSGGQPGGPPGDTAGAAADSLLLSPDTTLAADTATGPRRRQTVQPITLLSITTDAMVYDFVEAREEGEGFQTAELGHSVTSDLLRGLQISFAHNLFERVATDTLGGTKRRFKPFLSRVTASFSLSSNSWLAKVLGLGPRSGDPQSQQEQQPQELADTSMGPQVQRSGAEFGLLGAGRSTQPMQRGPAGAAGTWNASFNYTMSRQRDGASESQMLTANLSFQPTTNWSLRWQTGYSFNQSEFTDHILTLTRTLHDWDANFDFVKAQNGNFSFQFRVSLRANPDIKMDYEQRELRRFSPTEIR